MNWDAIGALAEIFGAIAVVATLGYLAAQMRQNTRAIRGQAIGTQTQLAHTEMQVFLGGSDLTETFLKAIADPDSLTPSEHMRMDAWMITSFNSRQNEFLQHRLGTLDEEIWAVTSNAITENLGNAYGRRWWQTLGRHRFAPEFVAFVESLGWQETDGATALDMLEPPS